MKGELTFLDVSLGPLPILHALYFVLPMSDYNCSFRDFLSVVTVVSREHVGVCGDIFSCHGMKQEQDLVASMGGCQRY
jgi:hypothetical protein